MRFYSTYLIIFLFFCSFSNGSLGSKETYGFMEAFGANGRAEVCLNFDPEVAIATDHRAATAMPLNYVSVDALQLLCEMSLTEVDRFRHSVALSILYNMSYQKARQCSVMSMVDRAERHDAKALLMVLNSNSMKLFRYFQPPFVNRTFLTTPLYFMRRQAYLDLQSITTASNSSLSVRVYQPQPPLFDGALFILSAIAIFCVATGSIWGGWERYQLHYDEQQRHRQQSSSSTATSPHDDDASTTKHNSSSATNQHQQSTTNQRQQSSTNQRPESTEAVDLQERGKGDGMSMSVAVGSVLCMLSMLVSIILLLYYFYHYFVWVIIVGYVLASSCAVYSCLVVAVDYLLPAAVNSCTLPFSFALCCESLCNGRRLPCFVDRNKVRISHILLYLPCAAFAICWCIYRHQSYAYLLQDILNIFFSIHIVRNLRLTSLKWLTLLLIGVLVYDVFFVFVTPYLTKSGCSIMVEVATGHKCSEFVQNGGSDEDDDRPLRSWYAWDEPVANNQSYAMSSEQLPIIFTVPKINDPMRQCADPQLAVDQLGPSLLGLGDVILPGTLTSFCAVFDFCLRSRVPLYFVVSVGCYALGLMVTLCGLVFSSMAQPALLYLVPFTLIPVHILAYLRGHWKMMWHGEMPSSTTVVSTTLTNNRSDGGGEEGTRPLTFDQNHVSTNGDAP